MEGQLVTGRPSNTGADGGKTRLSALLRYSETFEKMCGYYMSLGMSYSDYWDGDNTMTKYYRDADDYKRDRENFNLWLQATYIYQALLDVAPVLRPFAKHARPRPFLTEPIPLKSNKKEKQESENERKMQNGKKAMLAMAASINNKFVEKQRKEG